MNNINLYRTADIQAITDNLDKIIDESLEIKNSILEPTMSEYNSAMEIIKEYISKKGRIVYGGKSYNQLIGTKEPKDQIYGPNDMKDIEFYSFEPINDMVELCNIFQDKNFKFVRSTQAFHNETYKLFVNFTGLCDVSYMPKNIYSNMPVVKIDKILYSHPTWMLVDILRQYNDPITSYWRLKDKTFFRATKLLKHYPLELNTSVKIPKNDKYLEQKTELFKNIMFIPTLIYIGSIAENYYQTLNSSINCTKIQVLSVNYKEDVKTILAMLEKILESEYSKLEINFYRPFFQFWDERVEFVLNGTCLIKIFNHNNICLPYNNLYINHEKINKIQTGGHYKEIKGGSDDIIIKIGTFMLLFNHLLISKHYDYINRKDSYKIYEHLMYKLLKQRETYLDKHHKTVIDNTPYREFVIRCVGKTEDSGRAFRLKMLKKKETNKRPLFSYDPGTQRSGYKVPDFKFANTSGNIVINKTKNLDLNDDDDTKLISTELEL